MDKLTILRDDLRTLKMFLDNARLVAKRSSIKDIYYEPVPIADRLASVEGQVNYADLIEGINDYVTYELEQTEKAINDGKQQSERIA